MLRFIFAALLIFTLASIYSAQSIKKPGTLKPLPAASFQAVKSSSAYAELLLRKTERESELEEFLLDYTEEFPKVKEIKFELGSIQKEMDKILSVNAADAGKLTLALGKLLVRKTEIETDLWNVKQQYNDDHPEVKRAKRKIEVFEKAIKEILP